MKKPWLLVVVLAIAVVVLAALLVRQREKPADMEAERAALLEAFGTGKQALIAKDLERFVSLWEDEGSRLPPDAPIVTGKEALREFTAQLLATPGFALSFPEPGGARVSRAGDLGYTTGGFELTVNDPEGNPVTSRGKVVVVWEKQPDGAWKAVLDIWNFDAPRAAAPES